MKKYNINKKLCLVTGAASGIGLELARALAAEGGHLVLVDLPGSQSLLEEISREIKERYGVNVSVITQDLSLDDGPRMVYEKTAELGLHVDVLVNNAGVMAYGFFHAVPLRKSENLVKVNITAYMSLMRLFLPDMIARGEGRVLNVSSVAAFQPTANHVVYGATKAFVQSLTEGVREELHGTGVVVSTLNPTYTNTPMLQQSDFPKNLWWYSVSGLGSPQKAAQAGVETIINGRAWYIPGFKNRLIHQFLPRFLPRRVISILSYYTLKAR